MIKTLSFVLALVIVAALVGCVANPPKASGTPAPVVSPTMAPTPTSVPVTPEPPIATPVAPNVSPEAPAATPDIPSVSPATT